MTRRGTFSQHGEDSFVLQYFGGRPGFYVDVGANHPFRLSNTYLLYVRGWKGITVEPQPALSRKHRLYRPNDVHFNVGAGSEEGTLQFYEMVPHVYSSFDQVVVDEFVSDGKAILSSIKKIPIRKLSELFKETQMPQQIDFVSIDCEGHDFDVLCGADWTTFKPTLLSVETDHQTPGRDVQEFLKGKGYLKLKELGVNTFFERSR